MSTEDFNTSYDKSRIPTIDYDGSPMVSILYTPGGVMPDLTPYLYQLIEVRIASKYISTKNKEVQRNRLWGGHFYEYPEIDSLLPKVSESLITFPSISHHTHDDACHDYTVPPTSMEESETSESTVQKPSISASTQSPVRNRCIRYHKGDHYYTDDSDIVAMLHHCGHMLLTPYHPLHTGISVFLRVLPALPFYPSSTQGYSRYRSRPYNGVHTRYTLQLVRTEHIGGSLHDQYLLPASSTVQSTIKDEPSSGDQPTTSVNTSTRTIELIKMIAVESRSQTKHGSLQRKFADEMIRFRSSSSIFYLDYDHGNSILDRGVAISHLTESRLVECNLEFIGNNYHYILRQNTIKSSSISDTVATTAADSDTTATPSDKQKLIGAKRDKLTAPKDDASLTPNSKRSRRAGASSPSSQAQSIVQLVPTQQPGSVVESQLDPQTVSPVKRNDYVYTYTFIRCPQPQPSAVVLSRHQIQELAQIYQHHQELQTPHDTVVLEQIPGLSISASLDIAAFANLSVTRQPQQTTRLDLHTLSNLLAYFSPTPLQEILADDVMWDEIVFTTDYISIRGVSSEHLIGMRFVNKSVA